MEPTSGIPHSLSGNPFVLLAEGGGGFNPVDLTNTTLLFWTAVVFVILLFLLTKLAWKPLMQTVESREKRIREDLDRAEKAKADAEAALEEHRLQLEKASQDAKAVLDEARTRAEKLQQELKTEALAEIQGEREKARREIDAERLRALSEIKDHVVELSIEVNRRLAARSIGAEDHAKEVEGLLAKLNDVT